MGSPDYEQVRQLYEAISVGNNLQANFCRRTVFLFSATFDRRTLEVRFGREFGFVDQHKMLGFLRMLKDWLNEAGTKVQH